jgi:predicted RNase H-like HicB family nuclease
MSLKMVYWQDEEMFVGRLLNYPNVATQGETLEELEENIKDAFELMYFEDVPENYHVKEVVI